MTSDYREGDVISLSFGFRDRSDVVNYQIVRVLPAGENGQRQYRVRGSDGRERRSKSSRSEPASRRRASSAI